MKVEDVPNALVLLALTDTILGTEPTFEDYYEGVRCVGRQVAR